jgi:hypothetical protein
VVVEEAQGKLATQMAQAEEAMELRQQFPELAWYMLVVAEDVVLVVISVELVVEEILIALVLVLQEQQISVAEVAEAVDAILDHQIIQLVLLLEDLVL